MATDDDKRLAGIFEKALDDWLHDKIEHLMDVLFEGAARVEPDAVNRMARGAKLASEVWRDAHAKLATEVARLS